MQKSLPLNFDKFSPHTKYNYKNNLKKFKKPSQNHLTKSNASLYYG